MKDYRGEINRIIHDIKARSGWQPGKTPLEVERMGLVTENVACLDGHSVNRKILVFRSNGCHWAKRNGCSMCGYFIETTGDSGIITSANYVNQLRHEVEGTDFSQFPVLCLFTAGSFLDDWEFPWDAAQEVFRLLGQEKQLKKLIIESCAEYVDEWKLARLRELIGNKTVEVGIGLESSDPYVLRNCVNKDFTLDVYNDAVRVLKKYFNVLSYVLVKPPFLNEREALELAVETGRYAFRQGSNAVSLEPMYVERHTLVDFLFREGYLFDSSSYRPPWLWTVFEAVRILRKEFPEREVRIGNSDELPRAYHLARNCDRCSDEASRRIQEYAQSYDLSLLDGLDCDCKRDWKMSLEDTSAPASLDERLRRFVKAYSLQKVEHASLIT
jgi:radical SAM enzyme (TIGR01210 family)